MTGNLIIICTLAFSLFLSQTVHGCFCSVKDVKSTFSSADAVFIGKVSKITIVKRASVGYLLSYDSSRKSLDDERWKKSVDKIQKVTLDVVEPFKGATHKTFVLSTSVYNGSGSCGVPFRVGESYIVFAYQTEPMLSEDENARPKENWTLEMRLKSEADKFNKQLPLYSTSICSNTNRSAFLKDKIGEIRSFLKDGVWKESDNGSPFMPSLSSNFTEHHRKISCKILK